MAIYIYIYQSLAGKTLLLRLAQSGLLCNFNFPLDTCPQVLCVILQLEEGNKVWSQTDFFPQATKGNGLTFS